MTLLEALFDAKLFKPHFPEKLWKRWFAFLRALTAERPTPDDLATYNECTGRSAWPSSPSTEAVLIVGRRGGKSRTLALIATYLACFKDYSPYLAPGEVATIAVLASDRKQARAIFRFVIGLLEGVPLLAPMVVKKDTEQIVLSNRVVIEISTASFRSTRGYTYAAVLADEVAFWYSDETSANPDVEILRALRPGLANIPGAPLLIASSPYAKRGELYNAWRRYFGREDAPVLVWKASTKYMHPGFPQRLIDEATETDPESARAEYFAEFRSDLIDFVTPEAVAAVTAVGRERLPFMSNVSYRAFIDPAAGGADSMTLGIGHQSGDVGILDLVWEMKAPVRPDQAVEEIVALLRAYNVSIVMSDRYGGDWVAARFRERGIEVVYSKMSKSDIYSNFLPLINAGRVELLDNRRLANQLAGLERRTARSGKDSIDHGPNLHDDVANAVCGVLTSLDLDRRPGLVDLKNVTGAGGAGETPRWLQSVMLIVADAGPDIGAIFVGMVPDDGRRVIYILDADAHFFAPGLFGELIDRLRGLATKWHARGMGIIAPEHLLPRFEGRGVSVGKPPQGFDPKLQLTFAAECIASRLVRFTPETVVKMATRPIGPSLTLKAGDEIETVLQEAMVTTVALAYTPA